MTGEELYTVGTQHEQLRRLIPCGLTPCLPRLEWMDMRLVLQFWYFQVDVMIPWREYYPLFYAELDASTHRLTAFRALTSDTSFRRSFLDLWLINGFEKEQAYLNHCAALLAKVCPTQQEIVESQAMWLDAQCGNLTNWAQLCSGIRTEAVHQLLAADPQSKTRNLATLWKNELMLSGFIQGELLRRGQVSEGNDHEELCRTMYQQLIGEEGYIFRSLEDMQHKCASRY